MSRSGIRVAPGIAHEVLAGEVVIHLPGLDEGSPSTAIRLSHDTAKEFLRVAQGQVIFPTDSSHVADLLARGILVEDTTPSVSRRTALTAGVAGVGTGIILLTLPHAAVASSVPELQGLWSWQSDDGELAFFAAVAAANIEPGDDTETIRSRVSSLTVEGRGDFAYGSYIPSWPPISGPAIRWTGPAPLDPGDDTIFIGTFTLTGISYRVRFTLLPQN